MEFLGGSLVSTLVSAEAQIHLARNASVFCEFVFVSLFSEVFRLGLHKIPAEHFKMILRSTVRTISKVEVYPQS